LQTSFGGTLYALAGYGKDYLTEEEFAVCWNEHLSEYYEFLGKSLLKSRDQKFWEYHKNKLNELGGGYSRIRLASAAAKVIGGMVLSPKALFAKGFQKENQFQTARTKNWEHPHRLASEGDTLDEK
jgi:hypothetical protein